MNRMLIICKKIGDGFQGFHQLVESLFGRIEGPIDILVGIGFKYETA